MRQAHFSFGSIMITTTTIAVILVINSLEINDQVYYSVQISPIKAVLRIWYIGGTLCSFMAERPRRLPCLGQWRSFKVMIMISNKASLRSLFPIVSASHCIISLEKKKPGGTQQAPIWFIWRDRLGFHENDSRWGGGACCFHSAKNIAFILNILTGEQQNTISLMLLFSWCDSVVCGRRLPSKEVTAEEAQQHKRLE